MKIESKSKKSKKFFPLVWQAAKILKPKDIMVGFSMGALIAHCATCLVPVNKAILASISPYLCNEYKTIRKINPKLFDKTFGKILINDIKDKTYSRYTLC